MPDIDTPPLSSPQGIPAIPEFVPAFGRQLVSILRGADGLPCGATALIALPVPPERVWPLVHSVERLPERVPMISRSARIGNRVQIDLRFKIAVFSAKFGFEAEVVEVENRSIEIKWISGEPKDIRVRYDLTPFDDGRSTLVQTNTSFDISSLGWLVKFFLRHHPEIQFGVFPGSALVLQENLRKAFSR